MVSLETVFAYAVPVVVAAAALEGIIISLRKGSRYDWRAFVASLADLIGRQYGAYVYLPALATGAIAWAWTNRVATVPLNTVLAIALLFVGEEFCYYWFHRCSHRIRWFWASHAVHHSPNQLNLSAAFRIGWTGRLAGSTLFYVPLIWLGFPPSAVFASLTINLLYQFWLHTTWIPQLGPLEHVLNTPAHHRVHHGSNPEYLDANYGGVLIVFDRLFGTFMRERDDVVIRYGLVAPLLTNNPVCIAFHEWAALARDICAAPTWRQRLACAFGPPGGRVKDTPPAICSRQNSTKRRGIQWVPRT